MICLRAWMAPGLTDRNAASFGMRRFFMRRGQSADGQARVGERGLARLVYFEMVTGFCRPAER